MTPLFAVIITFGLIFTVLATLAQGLSSTLGSLRAGFQGRRQSDVMLILAKMIAIPVILIGLAVIIPLGPEGEGPQIRMAVCVVALTAGAPFIPWVTGLAKGSLPYAASVSILLTVLTFILLPFTLPFTLTLVDTGATISSWEVAWPMLAFMVLPLLVGMFVRARYPSVAIEVVPYLGPIAITALLVHVTLFITATWDGFTSLFWTGVIAFAIAIPLISMLTGYLASPPYVLSPVPAKDPHHGAKIVSVVAASLSNTGVTILCAVFALAPYGLAGVAILVMGVATIVVTVLVMAEAGKRHEHAISAGDGAVVGVAS